ncbi:unnamed protein product [Paramecium sonneborni]|uniref:Uncharacterized protein n=1 Tax=Paramecium sonneborni TaxID=65129 RepID=A0A8S1LM75_9CILI|nr:unnamed protein product [Paramecium sonneborni]
MKRPKSAQAQKLSARNKEEILEQKLSPNRPTDQKQSLTKTIKLKVQHNNNDIVDDNQMTKSDLFNRKKSDHFILFTSFQHKIRLQQNEIEILKQQVQLQQRIAENIPNDFQFQIQQYEEEISRLQAFLDEALQRGSEPKKNQILSYLSKIQEQKGEINRIRLLNDNLQRELEKLQVIVKKQQEQLMKGNQQFYKKQINQNDNQNDEIKTIQHQFNQQLQEKDKKLLELTKNQQQNQIKLNSYLQNVDQLNSQLQAKQNVIKLLEVENDKLKEEQKYLEDQLKEQQENINELTQEKQQLEDNLQQKEQLLNQLEEKEELYQQRKNTKKSLSIIKSISIFDYYEQPQKLVINEIEKPQKKLNIQKLSNLQIINKNQIQKYDFECQCELIINTLPEERKQINQIENDVDEHQLLIQNSSFQEQNQEIKEEKDNEIISEIVSDYLSSFVTNIKDYQQPNQYYQKNSQDNNELAIAQEVSNYYLDTFIKNFSTEEILIIQQEVENYLQSFIEKSNL